MKMRFAIAAFVVATRLYAQTGSALPPWTAGMLDIHQISTGRGNAAFFRFPDGTTMLVDAGAIGDGIPIADTEPRPNASHTSGDWIVRYIQRVTGETAPRLDYAVLTHFHPDHMGAVTAISPASAVGEYKLTGITEVGERLPIGTLIDRGFSYLAPAAIDTMVQNYRAFTAAQQHRGMKLDTLHVGRNDQIVLVHDAGEYRSFDVRGVAANGEVWTGTGTETRQIFPPLSSLSADDRPSENMCSIGLLIRYGAFSYFTGGDMPGVPDAGAPEWQSVEAAVARAIGPTEVHVVNHHGSISPESPVFLSTLRSRVMILPAWSPTHPSQDVLKRMLSTRLYPGPRDIFVTNLRTPTKASIGSRVEQLKADHGHIVVRVAPGGNEYRVFVLDDTTEAANVTAVFGPYPVGKRTP